MLFEPRADIERRQVAARQWLEQYHEKMMNGDQPRDEVSRALMVIVLTHKTSDFLAEHDPQSLKQAQEALGGSSWENFINRHPVKGA